MTDPSNLLSLAPQGFVEFLKQNRLRRFYFVYDEKNNLINASHAILQPIADFLENDRRDFMQHEGLFFQTIRKKEKQAERLNLL